MAAFIILFVLLAVSVNAYISYDSFIKAYESYPTEVLQAERVTIHKEDKSPDLGDMIASVIKDIGCRLYAEKVGLKSVYHYNLNKLVRNIENQLTKLNFKIWFIKQDVKKFFYMQKVYFLQILPQKFGLSGWSVKRKTYSFNFTLSFYSL